MPDVRGLSAREALRAAGARRRRGRGSRAAASSRARASRRRRRDRGRVSACVLVARSAPSRGRPGDAGSSHDAGPAARRASALVALDLAAPLGAGGRARAGRRRRVRLAPVIAGQRLRRAEGPEGRRRDVRAAGDRQGRVRRRRGSAGAGRLDAAVGQGGGRSRRARGAGRGLLRPSRATTCSSSASPAPTARRRPATSTAAIFDEAGVRCGRIGTVSYDVGGEERDAPRTTPEATDFQRMLREMAANGCGACAAEVSSHALVLKRVDYVRFAAGDLHQPDPRSPRLPRRHGLVLRGQAPAVRAAAAGGDRRR